MNSYNNLITIKRRLDPSGSASDFGTTHDTDLLALLVAASRQLDKYTNRFFYVDATTRYFDGAPNIAFLDDILSITTLKTDEDGDATYENSLTETTDYHLYPLNSFPKTRAEINPAGSYGGFGYGIRKGIEIIGNFGYGNETDATPYKDSTSLLDELGNITATITAFTVDDGDDLGVGQTILLDSEQMYITAIATNEVTVIRAVNGTTGAIHLDNVVIYIYEYPEPIMEACLIQAMRWWKRKDTAFQDVVASPATGEVIVYKGLDPDLQLIVSSYRKRNI